MTNLTVLTGTSTRLYFVEILDDRRDETGLMELNSTVAALRTARDSVMASRIVGFDIFPKNNPARNTIHKLLDPTDIAYVTASSNGLYSWLAYANGDKLEKVLVNSLFAEIQTLLTVPQLLDYDGNVYSTVVLGTQEWIVQNLKTTHYGDGTLIPNITDDILWAADVTGAMCWYNNARLTNEPVYGALYNWYAVDNAHGLAYFTRGGVQEVGWRVPSVADGATLLALMGGDLLTAGGFLKEVGTTHWLAPNVGATDNYGLSLLGNGNRGIDDPPAGFDSQGIYGDYYTSDETDAVTGTSIYVENLNTTLVTGAFAKYYGLSVRCVRDI